MTESTTNGEHLALWGGRFKSGPSPELARLSKSTQFDWRLADDDIAGSRAHARALGRAGLLTADELQRMEDALDGLQRTVETQLADEHITTQTVGGNIAIGRKDGYGKREVKSTAHLSETRRREVGRDVGNGKLQTRIEQSCRNAVAALPHGLVAQSREPVTDASRQTHLDGDRRHLQSIYCRAISLDKHLNSYLV